MPSQSQNDSKANRKLIRVRTFTIFVGLFFIVSTVALIFAILAYSKEQGETNTINNAIENNPTVITNSEKKTSYPWVDVATTQPVSLTEPIDIIDGVTVTNNMRVIVRQNPNSENGIYNYVDSKLERSIDMSTNDWVVPGGIVYVRQGQTFGKQMLLIGVTDNDEDNSKFSENVTFEKITSSVLPVADDKFYGLTSESGQISWNNRIVKFDEEFATNAILTRSTLNTAVSSGVTIDATNNMKGLNSLSMKNSENKSFELLYNNLSLQNVKTVLPGTIPSVGNFLGVSSIDVDNNIITTEWSTATISEAQIVFVQQQPSVGQFNNIKDAIASITDASENKQYIVSILPGTYNEDNIMVPSYIAIQGSDEDTVVINGGQTNNIFELNSNTGITSVTITSDHLAGSLVQAISVQDAIDVFLETVFIKNCSIGVKVKSSTTETVVRMHNLIISDFLDCGVHIESSGGHLSFGQLTVTNFIASNVGTPISLILDGPDVRSEIQTCSFEGVNTSVAIEILNGGELNLFASNVNKWQTGINVPVQTGSPSVIISAVEFDAVSLELNIQEPDCTGHLTGYANLGQVNILNESKFFIVGNDPKIITVSQKGSDFESVAAAIAYVGTLLGGSAPTAADPIIISVGPGTYEEPPFTIKSYVLVRGSNPLSTTINSLLNDTTFITMEQHSELSNCTINCPTGSNGVGVLYEGGIAIAAGVTLDNVHMSGDDFTSRLVYATSDFGTSSATLINMNQVKAFGKFKNFIDMNNTTGFNVSLIINDFEWLNPSSITLTTDVVTFLMRGVESVTHPLAANTTVIVGDNIVINDSRGESNEAKAIGIECQSLGNIGLTGGTFGQLKTSIDMQNLGSAQKIRIRNTLFANIDTKFATSEVKLSNPNVIGSINATIDTKYITINPSAMVSVNAINPDNGNTAISGILSLGTDFSNLTNTSNCLNSTCTVGLYSGGKITIPPQPDLTNFEISSGSGYIISSGHIKYLEWDSKLTITLTDNQSSYIYIDENTTIQESATIPVENENIIIARVLTNSGNVIYAQEIATNIRQYQNSINTSNTKLFGSVFFSGGTASVNGSDQINVVSGEYYYGAQKYDVTGGTPISFSEIYDNGAVVSLPTVTNVNLTEYNPGTGLVPIPDNSFVRHTLYTVNGNTFLFVFSQVADASINNATLPTPPPYFGENIVLIASIVVEKTTGPPTSIHSIEDLRPRPNFIQSISTVGGSADHSLLTNRNLNDAHSQYLLKSGNDPLSGTLDMGTNNIINLTTITDGGGTPITLSTISTRLLPDSPADPLPTGAPVSISTSNNAGVANSFARSDHQHDHGNLGGGTLHALANASSHGFMTSSDFNKLGASTSTPTASTLVEWDASSNMNAQNFITGNSGELKLNNAASSFSFSLKALSSLASNLEWTLPSINGNNGEFLQTNGSGVLTWGVPTAGSSALFQRRTSDGNNLNTGAPSKVIWSGPNDFIDSNFEVQPGNQDIKVVTSGNYEIYTNIANVSNSPRVNCIIKFLRNAVELPGQAYTGYIRDSTSNNEASGSLSMVYALTAGDLISVTTQQEAGNGNVNMIGGQSVIRIRQV